MNISSQLIRAQLENRSLIPSNPALGMVYYDTASKAIKFWDGANWQSTVTPTGVVNEFLGTTAPTGWLLLNGQTIGQVGSGASQMSADYLNLYTLLWNSFDNTKIAIQDSNGAASTRGASASADFTANKRLPLPNPAGRSFVGAGSGAGLTARSLGDLYGEETHALTKAEMPRHTHGVNDPGHSHAITRSWGSSTGQGNLTADGGDQGFDGSGSTHNASTGISNQYEGGSATTQADSNGDAHNNLPPSFAINYIVKI